jgi:hypothetical protein
MQPKRIKKPKHLRQGNHVSMGAATAQEKNLARRIGGRVTKGSGNQDDKGDVVLDGVVRIECKTTADKSYGLSWADIQKIEKAVANTGELPCMVIQWTDPNGRVIGEAAVMKMKNLDDVIAAHQSNRLDQDA